jgi:hypothetical protein
VVSKAGESSKRARARTFWRAPRLTILRQRSFTQSTTMGMMAAGKAIAQRLVGRTPRVVAAKPAMPSTLVASLPEDIVEIVAVEPPVQITSIASLSEELLHLILDSLPTSSALAFALCSLRYGGIIDLGKLRAGSASSEWNVFLRLLERDLPNYILCAPCTKLHRMPLPSGLKIAKGASPSALRKITRGNSSCTSGQASPLNASRWP